MGRDSYKKRLHNEEGGYGIPDFESASKRKRALEEASRLGLKATRVTKGGATYTDITGPQYLIDRLLATLREVS